ncbi:MAG: ribosome biogenesis GTP-binding protein YihA/YsxC [Firmicutes bacterium]|nr:ribosome biogenesis GTP-binding protein YihA/YsxC [Bacillota bacterium]
MKSGATHGKGTLVKSALDIGDMPKNGWSEVAFLGRSNAGKSSLINALVGRKIAHTSGTPGRTQRIHFYAMPSWYIVDLPGFGYARVSKMERAQFGQAVDTYLQERQPLVAAILIQDVRRDPEDEERMVVQWALERNLLFLVAASKIDRLNQREKREREERLKSLYPCPVYLVSSRTREGVDAIKQAIGGLGLQF